MISFLKDRRDIILSAIITCTILTASWLICGISFETNDDTAIMMFVSGAKTGTPTAATIFCNVLWGAFVSSLYRISGYIPWYTIIYMILIACVLTLLCYSCIKLLKEGSKGKEKIPYVKYLTSGGYSVYFIFRYLLIIRLHFNSQQYQRYVGLVQWWLS